MANGQSSRQKPMANSLSRSRNGGCRIRIILPGQRLRGCGIFVHSLKDRAQRPFERAAGDPAQYPAAQSPVLSLSRAALPGSHANLKPKVHDHELLRIIGQGAYGDVWLARNILGEYRAVKVVWRRGGYWRGRGGRWGTSSGSAGRRHWRNLRARFHNQSPVDALRTGTHSTTLPGRQPSIVSPTRTPWMHFGMASGVRTFCARRWIA
jgi:hypothetical protein